MTVFGACWVCKSGLLSKTLYKESKAAKIEAEMGIHDVVWIGFISNG